MRKTFNILYITTLILAVSFWGDVAVLLSDLPAFAATEMLEKVDEKEKEVKNYVEEFEKVEIGGQGGDDFNDKINFYISVTPPQFILSLPKPIIPSCVVYENSVIFKRYNETLNNSLYQHPLFILYCCPKSFLV